jgi:hypothetical protein
MDLELSDQQTWLAESVETLLTRHWVEPGAVREADDAARARVWHELVEFGALSVGEDGLGAVELCLIGRALGRHLASTPFIAAAAVRWAAPSLLEETESIALGSDVDQSFDPSLPVAQSTIEDFVGAAVGDAELAQRLLGRVATIGALLAAAEAVGAAGQMLADAIAYAGQRKQFGHTIGSNQALRHLLADMYMRQSSSWSAVLYAAAALDDGAADAAQTASIAKAYVSRAAREVAHGALQVFGGIAFTDEHPAHRFLRRIVVRERQFGDAAYHERALGRALAESARARVVPEAPLSLELAEGRA